MKYRFFVSFFIIGLPVITQAQNARQILAMAISAQGKWENVQTFHYRSHRANSDQWQGYDYRQVVSEHDMYELTYDFSSSSFDNHTVNHYPGGYVFDTHRVGLDSVYWVYDGLNSRTGKALLNLGKALYGQKKNRLLETLPYYVLKAVSDSADLNVERKGNYLILRSAGNEYWLNKKSLLLEKYISVRGRGRSIQIFNDYTVQDGLQLPKHHRLVSNGKIVYQETLQSFAVNPPHDSLQLQLPVNYVKTTEYNGPMIVKRLSPRTFLIEKIDGDRNILFIDMGNYVVLTEAPVSGDIAKTVLDKIAEVLPGKPVKYVHLSHFHKDHIAGVAELAAKGISIICTPETVQPVKDLISQNPPVTGKIAMPKFVLINQTKSIGKQNDVVKFLAIRNSHAKGMSFVYLPKERLIFQGDLLSLPEDGTLTKPIRINKEFFKAIRQNRLHYKVIIGHHGLPAITPRQVAMMELKSARK
jgi:glyoxylase-like metal-dependent hydrolase (beta-lactamase superfamily II)